MFQSETQQDNKGATNEVVMDFEHLKGLMWGTCDKTPNGNPGRVLSSITSKDMKMLGAEKCLEREEGKVTFRKGRREREDSLEASNINLKFLVQPG